MLNSLKFAMLTLLLAGCASQQPFAVDLPPAPKPIAPAEALQPLPEPLHFLRKLNEIFGT